VLKGEDAMDNTNDDRKKGSTNSNFEKEVKERSFILKTKLYVPPLRDKIVSRSRLTARINISSEHKLTLLSAPAGYGKTTLASEWLKYVKVPYSWLSLDEGDDDPYRFFTYLLAALQSIEDTIGEQIQGVFSTPQNLPSLHIMGILINDITKVNKNFILVLDDFHVIQNSVIHKAMQYLVDNQPPSMHIVILTRNDPPLLLSRLRARSHIIEINQHDLCFTEGETEEFLCKTMDLKIEKD